MSAPQQKRSRAVTSTNEETNGDSRQSIVRQRMTNDTAVWDVLNVADAAMLIEHTRAFLADNDALHFMYTNRRMFDFYSAHPYRLKHMLPAPSDLSVLPSRVNGARVQAKSIIFERLSLYPLIGVGDLPESLEAISFEHTFSQSIVPGLFPQSLLRLRFDTQNPAEPPPRFVLSESGERMNGGDAQIFPPNLQSLEFDYWFKQPIPVGLLPPSLKSFRFTPNSQYSAPFVDGALPASLTEFVIPEFSAIPLLTPNTLPRSLVRLTLTVSSGSFDSEPQPFSLSILPQSLTALKLVCESVSEGVFPRQLTELDIGGNFNQEIPPGMLPPTLLSLTFDYTFRAPFVPGSLPSSLQTLTTSKMYSAPFTAGIIPPSLTSLSLGVNYKHAFNQQTVLSPALTVLNFGYEYNSPIASGVLPESLTKLLFHGKYNNKIQPNILPSNLTSLTLSDYNQNIDINVLPSSLTLLRFFDKFNKKLVINSLPLSLKTLHLPWSYNQPFPNNLFNLHQNLTDLDFAFSSKYNYKLNVGILPPALIRLQLSKKYNFPIEKNVLPETLQHLLFPFDCDFNQEIFILPKSLKTIKFGNSYNQIWNSKSLPSSLTSIIFQTEGDSQYNQIFEPGVLPLSLTHLQLSAHYNQPFVLNALPFGLLNLEIPDCGHYDQIILPNILPLSLQRLTLNNKNNILPKGSLPFNLIYLNCGSEYKQPINDEFFYLPQSLIKLELGRHWNQSLININKCINLTDLRLWCNEYSHSLKNIILPKTLKRFHIGFDNNNEMFGKEVASGVINNLEELSAFPTGEFVISKGWA